MKTKLKILAIFLLSTIALTTSCSDDEFSLPEDYLGTNNNFSSFKWYTSGSKTTSRVSEKFINLDSYVGFYNVSENALSHQWEIPTSGKFLNKKFTDSDSIYTSFIVPSESLVSEDDLINVLFTEAGIKEVKLISTFRDSIENGVKIDNYWQVEKIFTIDVFANTNPECKVFKYDYSVDPDNPTLVEILHLTADDNPSVDGKDSWETVSIEAGEELVYADLSSEGRPTTRTFYLDGGKPDTSKKDTAVVKYNKLGEFTAYMESSRSGGDTIPKYASSKLIPLNIKVLPSTKPFELSGKATLEGDVISFSVTGEVEQAVNQKDFFTVHVTNEVAVFDQNIAIQSVSINSEDATIIEVKLNEPVFNTDEIEISFTGGNIVSVDSRNLQNFDPIAVNFDLGSSILEEKWAGFEKTHTTANKWQAAFADGYWVGGSNDDNGSKTDPIFAQTEDQVFEGKFSMKYEFDISKTITLQGKNIALPSGLPAGTYSVSYMIYLEPGNTMKNIKNSIQEPSQIIEWDIESLPRGEWVKISQTVTTGAVPSGKRFDIKIIPADNPGISGTQKMYFDNLSWIPLVPRT